jgi:hypothetical protein
MTNKFVIVNDNLCHLPGLAACVEYGTGGSGLGGFHFNKLWSHDEEAGSGSPISKRLALVSPDTQNVPSACSCSARVNKYSQPSLGAAHAVMRKELVVS